MTFTKPTRVLHALSLCAVIMTGFVYLGGVSTALAESFAAPAAWSGLWPQTSSDGLRAPVVTEQRADLFRQSPVLSGRLRVSEQTLIPYIGAGFGGGYVTERDRALNPQPTLPQQNLFGEAMGKSMMPNEFQMGIRIPF
ncbi:MAG TPA: hypothetical protein PKD38_13475 [Nitrospira sp.]|nr:hypothetical protein [Nitrospira sp.]